MSMYLCAACGSSRVVSEKKKEGYHLKKGLIGTLFMGNVGALAGVNGNEVTYYHCADCGQTLNYVMSEYEQQSILFALENKDKYFYMDRLNNFKKKYKNIEWEEVDVETLQKQELKKSVEQLVEDEKINVSIEKSTFLEGMLYDFFKQYGKRACIEQLVKVDELKNFSRQRMAASLRRMCEKGILKETYDYGKKYFIITENAVMPTLEMFPPTENKPLSDKAISMQEDVLQLLSDGKKRTVSMILKELNNSYTHQNIAATTMSLAKTGKIKKDVGDKVTYFYL